MKLIIVFGPHAVGKMTVGQELEKITQLKLFHNHMTIDVVSGLFRNHPQIYSTVVQQMRELIFDAFTQTDEYGMIFTYMWALDAQADWDYITHVEELFLARGADVYYVELCADYNERWQRNTTENRLLHKPTKRDIAWSQQLFRTVEQQYRLNTLEGELQKEHYIKIDNTNMPPEAVARVIQEAFEL